MQIRPITGKDLDALSEIDGTIRSASYLHVERTGDALSMNWTTSTRSLREPKVTANRLDDDRVFLAKQIATGVDDGLALLAEHDDQPAAMLIAQQDVEHDT